MPSPGVSSSQGCLLSPHSVNTVPEALPPGITQEKEPNTIQIPKGEVKLSVFVDLWVT